MDGQINLGNKSQLNGGADGIGFNFTPSNLIGNYGNGFGLGGIPNAVGFKFDTYYNASADNNANAAADPAIVGVTEPAKNTGGGRGYAFGAFDNTNSAGNIQSTTNNPTGNPARISEPDGKFHDVSFDYNGISHIMTVTYNGKTWSEDISSYVAQLKAANNGVASTYFSISASTGGSKNQQDFLLSKMTFYKPATLNGSDSTILEGSKWDPSDNFNTDDSQKKSSNSVDTQITIDDVTVTGTVDTSKAGDYPITYTYKDPITGETVSKQVTVTVEGTPAIIAKDTTIDQGSDWASKDNFVTGENSEDKMLTIDDVTVKSIDGQSTTTLDTNKLGKHEVVYTYNDPNKGEVTATGIVTVVGKPVVSGKDSTIFQGDEWNAADNFTSVMNSIGVEVPKNGDSLPAGVSVSGTVNTNTPGNYLITCTYTDPDTGKTGSTTVTVTVGNPSINGHDSDINVGDKWTPADNFNDVTDGSGNENKTYDGSGVKVAKITDSEGNVVDTVDTSKPGNYYVTYSFTDTLDVNGVQETKTVEKTVTVSVHGKPTVDGNDSYLKVGTPWTPDDNLGKITNSFDQEMDKDVVASDITTSVKNPDGTTSDKVDTSKPGKYEVTYTYTDDSNPNKTQTATKTVTVTVYGTPDIDGKDSTIKVGSDWKSTDNLTNITDGFGNDVKKDDSNYKVSVKNPDGTTSDNVDTSKPGQYEVTYTYVDKSNPDDPQTVTKTVTVTVYGKPAIDGNDSDIKVGDVWKPSDNLTNVTNGVGNDVPTNSKDITTSVKNPDGTKSDTVDTSKPGKYEVTYTYTDNTDPDNPQKVTKTVTVTVYGEPTIDGKDSNLKVGDDWKPTDNLTNVTDSFGNDVKKDDSNIEVSVKNSDGKSVDKVDTSKPGKYEVTYTYTDKTNPNKDSQKLTKTVTVTVTGTPKIDGKDSDLKIGDPWNPSDNLTKVTDGFDNDVPKDSDDITTSVKNPDGTTSNTVDTSKPGKYGVTYTYTDNTDPDNPQKVTKTVTVTVYGEPTIDGKDSNLKVGDDWKPTDNLTNVTDSFGKDVKKDDSNIKVSVNTPDGKSSDKVDTSKPGKYEVTYTYTDNSNPKHPQTVKKTVTVTVTGTPKIDGKDSDIKVGDVWKPSDNLTNVTNGFDNAVPKDSTDITTSVKNPDGTTSNTVDTSKPGKYEVTYTYTDNSNPNDPQKVTKTVTVNVYGTPVIEAQDSVVKKGSDWKPADNYVAKDSNDGLGNAVKWGDTGLHILSVDGPSGADTKGGTTVDTNMAGKYTVLYEYTNQAGQKVKATATVTVSAEEIHAGDSTINQGDNWTPKDNFDDVTNTDGDKIDYDQAKPNLTVDVKNPDGSSSDTVDTNTSGDYKVTYTYTDPKHSDDVVTKAVTVTVNPKAAQPGDSNSNQSNGGNGNTTNQGGDKSTPENVNTVNNQAEQANRDNRTGNVIPNTGDAAGSLWASLAGLFTLIAGALGFTQRRNRNNG